MLHIIGWILIGILKLVGIVFGLLLIVVLAILFVPIRYKVIGGAEGDFESAKAKGYVSWLLHIIHVSFDYKGGKTHTVVRLFGIQILPRKKRQGRIRKKASKETTKESENLKDTKKERIKTQKEEKVKEQKEKVKEVEEKRESKPMEKGENLVEIVPDTPVKSEGNQTEAKELDVQKPIEKTVHKEKKEKGKEKGKEKADKKAKTKDKGPSAIAQVKAFYEELHRPENEGVMRFVWKYIKRLIIWIFPRHMDLNLDIGLEDQVTTGYIAAVGAIGYGITKGHVIVVPHFDEELIAGSLKVKSHLFLYQLLYYIIRLIIDKRVRRMIAFIRK